MNTQDFSVSLTVDQSPQAVFQAINNVRGWWSEDIEGETDQLGAEFLYHYKDVHFCKMKISELVPNEKVTWQVLDNYFSFVEDQKEWKGDEIVFEISGQENQTTLHFTQKGLTPADECYNVCYDAWTNFVAHSLRDFISTGKGAPNPKDREGAFNEENIRKWNINGQREVKSFSFSFTSAQSSSAIFNLLLDIEQWWSGLYAETIQGKSQQLNDEFSFHAGGGVHYSKQKLIELIPNQKITWLVTESNLSSFADPGEWTGTKICFDLAAEGDQTKVTFTHDGLTPKFECYGGCSGAWTGYLEQLAEKLG